MSSSLSKKLIAAFLFVLAVVFLIGDDDNPGPIAETAENGTLAQTDSYEYADSSEDSGSSLSYEESAEEEYYAEDDGSDDAALIDDTQGFDPAPMTDVAPALVPESDTEISPEQPGGEIPAQIG